MKKIEMVQFEEQNIQLYTQKGELLMTMEELAKAVGFANNNVFKVFLTKNPELCNEEFSFLKKVKNIEGGIVKNREKRFFTEQGIYEAALLARTEKAKKFRKFARFLITKFHKKELMPINSETAIVKMQEFDNKLDKIERILLDRQEVFSKINDDTEKEISLLERLEVKLRTLDTVDERMKAIEGKIGERVDCVNSIIDTLEEE